MKEQKPVQSTQLHPIPQVYAPYYEDEISLVDLWLVLVKRKKVLFSVFLIFLLVAVLASVIKKDKYEFISVVEIGRIPAGNGFDYVESQSSAKAKLEQAYIASALSTFDEEVQDKFKVKIDTPKNTSLLSVRTKGVGDDVELQQQFHSEVLGRLIKDLNVLTDAYKDKQLSLMTIQKRGLELYKESQKLVIDQIQMKILQEEKELAKLKQQEKRSAVSSESVLLRSYAVKDLYDQKRKVAAETESQILVRESNISNMELNIGKVIATRNIVPFYQSVETKGLSSKILFILLVLVGFVIAIISAFVAEFSVKVKEKMKEEGMV